MRSLHSLEGVNLDFLRSFVAIAKHGSLNKAAEHLAVSQSTLTRQMNALEQEIGGKLVDRDQAGIALTAAGQALLKRMSPVLRDYDAAFLDVSRLARGQSTSLRIGYMPSAAAEYLHPPLQTLRFAHPEVKIKLFDLTPGEQIAALHAGEIDFGMLTDVGSFLRRDFFVKRIASLPLLVALSECHRLAKKTSIRLIDLKGERFVGAPDSAVPGHTQRIIKLCRTAGFRARFLEDSESLGHAMTLTVSDGAVLLLPEFAKTVQVPGVVFRPLQGASANVDLLIAWPRGRVSGAVRAMLECMPAGKHISQARQAARPSPDRSSHSARNEMSGSTREALRAGK